MRVASFGDKTCYTVKMAANEVALIGALDNRLTDGTVVLHDVQSSLKALKWDQPFQADVSFGQIRLIDARRAQCEFERWFAAEQNFPRDHGYPLPEWAGQTAVCGPIDGGGGVFMIEAPKVARPDPTVTIKINSNPSGQQAKLLVMGHAPVMLTTPFTGVYSVTPGAKTSWVLNDMSDNQLDAGEIDVLPLRECFNLPPQNTWNAAPAVGNPSFGFSTDEDKTGKGVLRVCGNLPAGFTLLLSGEAVDNEAYGVLTFRKGTIDLYVRNAGIEGLPGCLAAPEFHRLKAVGGSNLTIFHAPIACSVRQYVPVARI
jgi:hypothetical protein